MQRAITIYSAIKKIYETIRYNRILELTLQKIFKFSNMHTHQTSLQMSKTIFDPFSLVLSSVAVHILQKHLVVILYISYLLP